jgi:hypothetical protein
LNSAQKILQLESPATYSIFPLITRVELCFLFPGGDFFVEDNSLSVGFQPPQQLPAGPLP